MLVRSVHSWFLVTGWWDWQYDKYRTSQLAYLKHPTRNLLLFVDFGDPCRQKLHEHIWWISWRGSRDAASRVNQNSSLKKKKNRLSSVTFMRSCQLNSCTSNTEFLALRAEFNLFCDPFMRIQSFRSRFSFTLCGWNLYGTSKRPFRILLYEFM